MFQAAQAVRNGGNVISLDPNKRNTGAVLPSGIPIPSTTPNVPNERILQAFSIIDAHTRYINNNTIIENLNTAIHIISTIIVSQYQNWHTDEKVFIDLVEDYLPLFMVPPPKTKKEEYKNINKDIKNYIIYSCLIYLAVYNKDPALMKKYNSKIQSSVKAIIKYARESEEAPAPTTSTDTKPTKTPVTNKTSK